MARKKKPKLRDWFAGQALVGILMRPDTPRPETAPLEQHAAALAEQAYAYADAMLLERRRPAGGRTGAVEPPLAADAAGAFGPPAEIVERMEGEVQGSGPQIGGDDRSADEPGSRVAQPRSRLKKGK